MANWLVTYAPLINLVFLIIIIIILYFVIKYLKKEIKGLKKVPFKSSLFLKKSKELRGSSFLTCS